ncbi:MAG: archease [Ignavibacteriales bacterium]|nr:archease [Ignavibacteriales bacterium]
MDERFRILEHPADVGIEAYGETLQELFENSAVGLISIIAGSSKIESGHRLHVSIESTDIENLLVRWLSEILYLSDAEQFIFARADFEKISQTLLKGFVFGERYDPAKHQLQMSVKAVTYHQLKVRRQGTWSATVFLDV